VPRRNFLTVFSIGEYSAGASCKLLAFSGTSRSPFGCKTDKLDVCFRPDLLALPPSRVLYAISVPLGVGSLGRSQLIGAHFSQKPRQTGKKKMSDAAQPAPLVDDKKRILDSMYAAYALRNRAL
jgi:hypothetical protein